MLAAFIRHLWSCVNYFHLQFCCSRTVLASVLLGLIQNVRCEYLCVYRRYLTSLKDHSAVVMIIASVLGTVAVVEAACKNVLSTLWIKFNSTDFSFWLQGFFSRIFRCTSAFFCLYTVYTAISVVFSYSLFFFMDPSREKKNIGELRMLAE